MIEVWRNGRLVGYFKTPTGWTSVEFAAHYNHHSATGNAIVLW